MDYVWWEKTVEYLFVKEYLPSSSLFTPLDGRHELASDGILFSRNCWILIEFKAERKDIRSERLKYRDYDSCMKRVIDRARHHYFIFGEIEDRDSFKLVGCNYFDDNQTFSIDEILDRGAFPDSFTGYLIDLIECKRKASSSEIILDYSLVLGISEEEGIVQSLSVNAFLEQVEEELSKFIRESSDPTKIQQAEQYRDEIMKAKGDIEPSVVRFMRPANY
ncbi:hypothetical protein HJA60_004028 [Vibrio vulnificus]|nr:hypothetical protein [Vibrio vulnificus]